MKLFSARSWRLAARLSWHDAQRHKIATLVMFLIVLLPTTWALTQTYQQTLHSAGPQHRFGTTQAKIYYGKETTGTLGQTRADIEAITGRTAHPWVRDGIFITGVDKPLVRVLPNTDFGEKLTLLSGRWPTDANEILSTAYGQSIGLPTEGNYRSSTPDADATTYRVVGTVQALDTTYRIAAVGIINENAPLQDNTWATWFITGNPPITMAELKAWNLASLNTSHVTLPSPSDDDAMFSFAAIRHQSGLEMLGALAMTLLWICTLLIMIGIVSAVCALLLSPAFTVTAARQEQTMSRLAQLGADHGKLRQVLLLQGCVFGLLATTMASLITWGYTLWLINTTDETATPLAHYNTELPWGLHLVIVSAVIGVCTGAAAWPATAITAHGRVRTAVTPAKQAARNTKLTLPERTLTTVTAALFVLVVIAIFVVPLIAPTGPKSDTGQYWLFLATIYGLFFVGLMVGITGLMLTRPALLFVTQTPRILPAAVRLSLIDAARHSRRTIGVVIATATATSLLVGFSFVSAWLDSDEQDATYTGPHHEALAYSTYSVDRSPVDLPNLLPAYAPHLQYVPLQHLSTDPDNVRATQHLNTTPNTDPGYSWRHQVIHTKTCQITDPHQQKKPYCSVSSDATHPGQQPKLLAAPATELKRRFNLTTQQLNDVKNGTAIVPQHLMPDEQLYTSTKIRTHKDHTTTWTDEGPATKLPTLHVPATPTNFNGTVIFVATEAYPWKNSNKTYYVLYRADGKKINNNTLQDLTRAAQPSSFVFTHHTPLSPYQWTIVTTGALMVFFAALTVVLNALQTANTRRTLRALGTTSWAHHTFVGSQALVLSALGTLMGLAIGFIAPTPLMIFAHRFMTGDMAFDATKLLFPLLVFGLAVPILTAIMAAVFTPTAKLTVSNRPPTPQQHRTPART